MEREEERNEDEGTAQQDPPSTEELDEDPAYGGDTPVDDLKGG